MINNNPNDPISDVISTLLTSNLLKQSSICFRRSTSDHETTTNTFCSVSDNDSQQTTISYAIVLTDMDNEQLTTSCEGIIMTILNRENESYASYKSRRRQAKKKNQKKNLPLKYYHAEAFSIKYTITFITEVAV